MTLLAAIGLFILQVAALGKLGLAILPFCILWFMVGLTVGESNVNGKK